MFYYSAPVAMMYPQLIKANCSQFFDNGCVARSCRLILYYCRFDFAYHQNKWGRLLNSNKHLQEMFMQNTLTNSTSDRSGSSPGFSQSCRAKSLRIDPDFAECLIAPETKCSYRQPFGWIYLCHHPNHQAIVEHTNEQGG